MTKLKTLKDLKFIKEGDQRLIREVAIKWVKQHRDIKPNWAKETNEGFFMAFHNITEEDLK